MTISLFINPFPSPTVLEKTRGTSLNHVILGRGEPRAEQFNFTVSLTC